MAWLSRLCALLTLPVLLVLAAGPASADTPLAWPEPEPMSTLYAIGLFVGVPAALVVGIALLTMAPSVAKGPRYRPGLPWYADPVQFGVLPASDEPAATESGSQLATQGGGARGSW